MNALLELADMNADHIRTMGLRAIARAHAAGVSAYYMEPEIDGIVRHDADGRRSVVEITDGPDRILREIGWQEPYHLRDGLRTAAERE